MQERARVGFPAQEPNLNNLDVITRERIFEPTIRNLYTEFVRNGTYQKLLEIINHIPPEHHPPILYTLTTHVTKEKPVFIYGIGTGNSADEDTTRFVAASTDLLWCLSLMVDDIIDKDYMRANRKTTWNLYGQEETYRSAQVAFGIIQDLMAEILSPTAAQLLVETVNDSLKSLEDPVLRSMDSNVDDIIHNIDRRARFHCEYPIRALFAGNEKEEIISIVTDGLFCVNRAGQILNDVKDLVPSTVYGREPFTDIRSGTTTIPLVMLQNVSTSEEKQILRECFNCPTLTPKQVSWLRDFVTRKLPREQIYSLVSQNYKQFLETMEKVVPSQYLVLCQGWVDYKLTQTNKLLSN